MHQFVFGRKGYEIADIDLNYAEDEGLQAAITYL
jgi:glutamate synthase (NADPH/NADH) large chain